MALFEKSKKQTVDLTAKTERTRSVYRAEQEKIDRYEEEMRKSSGSVINVDEADDETTFFEDGSLLPEYLKDRHSANRQTGTLTGMLFDDIEAKRRESELAAENECVARVREKLKNDFGGRAQTEADSSSFREDLRRAIDEALKSELDVIRTPEDRERVTDRIFDLVAGLGPLEKLIKDKSITEIEVAGCNKVFIEKNGKMVLTDIKFGSEKELHDIITRIAEKVRRQINEATPIVDARLDDGSRVNAVLSPISLDGNLLQIRRFPDHHITIDEYLKFGSIDQLIKDFFQFSIEAGFNIIVAGGTGSGKTTLLNVLSNFLSYDPGLSVITIEDSAELSLNHPNVRRMETKVGKPGAGSEIIGRITSQDLVRNTLRQRPDRVIVGEIRDGDTYMDFLWNAQTGHEGSLTTIHAPSPEDLVSTTRILCKRAKNGSDMTEAAINETFTKAIDMIVQIKRYPDASRKVCQISEVVGYGKEAAKKLNISKDSIDFDPSGVYIREIIAFEIDDFIMKRDESGVLRPEKVIGHFAPQNYVPERLIKKANERGVYFDLRRFFKTDADYEYYLQYKKIKEEEEKAAKENMYKNYVLMHAKEKAVPADLLSGDKEDGLL